MHASATDFDIADFVIGLSNGDVNQAGPAHLNTIRNYPFSASKRLTGPSDRAADHIEELSGAPGRCYSRIVVLNRAQRSIHMNLDRPYRNEQSARLGS